MGKKRRVRKYLKKFGQKYGQKFGGSKTPIEESIQTVTNKLTAIKAAVHQAVKENLHGPTPIVTPVDESGPAWVKVEEPITTEETTLEPKKVVEVKKSITPRPRKPTTKKPRKPVTRKPTKPKTK